MEYNYRIALLCEEGMQAVRAEDWNRVDDIASYNADMGYYMIRMYENILPLELKCRIALFHYDYLKTLDGTRVAISGYMATSSPVDGSFMFLMNLPYQNCPFCVPNTSQLSNTMEVYSKKDEPFGYTNQAIKVISTLKVADSADKPVTDKYGSGNYRMSCDLSLNGSMC